MEMALNQKLIDRSGMDQQDRLLLDEIQDGLPLVSRPYRQIGDRIGLSEQEVVQRIARLRKIGVIKRMGVVVRHRQLGYRANAMVVWNIPDDRVDELGRCFAGFPFVTLCYQRPRRGEQWPYNLFCMIHGKQRKDVQDRVRQIVSACEVGDIPHRLLFSKRCFKQRGANYRKRSDFGHG